MNRDYYSRLNRRHEMNVMNEALLHSLIDMTDRDKILA